jgi:hypothetical protein
MSDYYDFNDDEDNELGNRRLNAKNHPLQLQLNELSVTVQILLDSADGMDDFLNAQKELIQQSVLIIKAKLYSALRSDSYLVCMQNASMIRYHAQFLQTSYHTLKDIGRFNENYVDVFRQEMEEFRELFKAWAQCLKQMDKEDLEDDWGLF